MENATTPALKWSDKGLLRLLRAAAPLEAEAAAEASPVSDAGAAQAIASAVESVSRRRRDEAAARARAVRASRRTPA